MVYEDRYVYLMRHGLAEPALTETDFNRTLTKSGQKEVRLQRLKFKKTDGIRPDCILSSTAKRAVQTTEILSDLFIGIPVFYRETLYLASAGRILDILKSMDNLFHRVLIIGHNPGLEQVAAILDCTQQTHILRPAECISVRVPLLDWNEIRAGVGDFKKLFKVRV